MIRKYNSTDVADFVNILAEDAIKFPFEVSLEETINSWIFQGGYPLVTVIRNYEEASAIIYQVILIKTHNNIILFILYIFLIFHTLYIYYILTLHCKKFLSKYIFHILQIFCIFYKDYSDYLIFQNF